uniref:hypothetical protein n=1 Tax=Rheinheimera sp. TaxID=1869214 RepID=UPI004047EEA0
MYILINDVITLDCAADIDFNRSVIVSFNPFFDDLILDIDQFVSRISVASATLHDYAAKRIASYTSLG